MTIILPEGFPRCRPNSTNIYANEYTVQYCIGHYCRLQYMRVQ